LEDSTQENMWNTDVSNQSTNQRPCLSAPVPFYCLWPVQREWAFLSFRVTVSGFYFLLLLG